MSLLARHSYKNPWTMLIVSLALIFGLSACADLVYRQDIQQGNVLEEDDLNQLQLGMTKRQVAVLLGSPSVSSPFHADRWDYVNTYARRGEDFVSRTLTLVFVDDALTAIEGNYLEQDSDIARLLRSLQSPDRQLEEVELLDPNT